MEIEKFAKINVILGSSWNDGEVLAKGVPYEEAMKIVVKERTKRYPQFRNYYLRMWEDGDDMVIMTIDFGSWSQFFYLVPGKEEKEDEIF